jgi:hypothetical protein
MIDALKAAFVQGRLTKDEFDERIGQALAARTDAELAAATVGIPVGPGAARPLRRPPRRQVSNAAMWGASGLFTPVIFAAASVFASLGGEDRYEAVCSCSHSPISCSGCLSGPACSGNGIVRRCQRQECVSGARTPSPLIARERPAQSGRVRLDCGDAARVRAMLRPGYHHRLPARRGNRGRHRSRRPRWRSRASPVNHALAAVVLFCRGQSAKLPSPVRL